MSDAELFTTAIMIVMVAVGLIFLYLCFKD